MFYVIYRWAASRSTPLVDDNQDLTVTFAEEINGRTTIAFTRARVTGDSAPIDVSLDGAVYFLWATGNENNFNGSRADSISFHSSAGVSSSTIQLPSAVLCPAIGKRNYLLPCAYTQCL